MPAVKAVILCPMTSSLLAYTINLSSLSPHISTQNRRELSKSALRVGANCTKACAMLLQHLSGQSEQIKCQHAKCLVPQEKESKVGSMKT